MDAASTRAERLAATNPLFNDNTLKLGTFGANVSNGCAATLADGHLEMTWPNTRAIVTAADALGFEIEVGYHNRSARADVPYRYFGDVKALAEWSDFLVVATPGGASTKHLVNADVLNALGARGVVVNIARGSVIDTAALAAALREGRIAAAGLDVYESEPAPPAELLDLDNVVLTPHVAGWSPEAVQASVDRFLENARRHLAGEAPVSPL